MAVGKAVSLTLLVAAVIAGCVPIAYVDQPADVAPALPADVGRDAENLLVIPTTRMEAGRFWRVDAPLFVRLGETSRLSDDLGRWNFGLTVGPFVTKAVTDLCIIDGGGRWVAMSRIRGGWTSTDAAPTPRDWRDQFASYLAEEQPRYSCRFSEPALARTSIGSG